MTTPSEKSPDMETFLDDLGRILFGVSRTEAIEGDICIECKGPATEFRDDLSRKEFMISGMCQKCQDETFGPDEDGDEEVAEN